LDENFSRLITTFDEVPLPSRRPYQRARFASHARAPARDRVLT